MVCRKRGTCAGLASAESFRVEDLTEASLWKIEALARCCSDSANSTQSIDLVYLDPPYEAENEYSGTLDFFGSVRGREILSLDALVIAEHSSKNRLAIHYGGLEHRRLLKQGDAALSFFGFPALEQNLRRDAVR